jgi:hypothetical protein
VVEIRFIDVSGVGNSGKSAVVDLLREIDGLFVPEYWFEFDFIRVPGGLLDLRHRLLEDWSPVRSHDAYHEFVDIVNKMGRDPTGWDILGLVLSTSQRYDGRFNGQFRTLALRFADSFRLGSYKAEWPYDGLREQALFRFGKKVLRRLGLRKHLVSDVLLLDGKDFDVRARGLMRDLYRLIVPLGCDGVVLNNGVEPFNPGPGLEMLGARQLVVTRDPRDVYVSGLNFHNVSNQDATLLAFDNDGMNKSFLATDDLALFVKRYRLYREKVSREWRPDVLHVPFERLVKSPDEWVGRILGFLDIESARRTRPSQFFQPARSAENVGIWSKYSKTDEIRFIETELADFLVDA